ncbi:hypothetical protein ACTJJ4_03095 [Microbacterium sp. 22195]|uniref:hypothetical protein n=1 Tax=Microbacterium sp. 22195 TaxID=3453891 RepID=UPI003F825F95
MNPESQSIDLTSIAVALGRIEVEVKSIRSMDERLRKVETDITELKAQQRPRAPWYTIVAGIGGILVIGLNGFLMLQLLAKVAAVAP